MNLTKILIGVVFLLFSINAHAFTTYIVKKGDTLITIAKKLNISPKLIKEANPHVNWLKIKPNDTIKIPFVVGGVAVELSKPNEEEKNSGQKNIYIIKKGDSLLKIAHTLNYSYKEIKKLNPNVDWSKIRPGQKILLPSKHLVAKKTPKPGEIGDGYYIVAKGDTLNSIAKRFGLTLAKLMQLNPGVGKIIRPGDLIVIPGDLAKKIMLSRKENLFIPPKYLLYSQVYRVKKGDTLWKIAKKFNTSIDIIKTINDINGRYLRVGQVLFVPSLNLKESEKLKLRYSIIMQERHALIRYAERFIGAPYRFGGDSLKHGIDCSAFVQKIYAKFKIHLPRTAEEQYRVAGVPVSIKRLQPGDLLFFHTLNYARVTHVAIYIGNGKFIHAAGRRSGVKISHFSKYYWKRFVGAKRVLGIDTRYAYNRGRSG